MIFTLQSNPIPGLLIPTGVREELKLTGSPCFRTLMYIQVIAAAFYPGTGALVLSGTDGSLRVFGILSRNGTQSRGTAKKAPQVHIEPWIVFDPHHTVIVFSATVTDAYPWLFRDREDSILHEF